MSHSSSTANLLNTLKELPRVESSYFASGVVITLTDLNGETISEFEILGDDLPAISKVCQQAVNNRLLMKRALLENELRSINTDLGLGGVSDGGITAKVREEIDLVSIMATNLMPSLKMISDDEALLIINTLDNTQTDGVAQRTKQWMKEVIKDRFTVDANTQRLTLKVKQVDSSETPVARARRLAAEVYPMAYLANEDESILIEETLKDNQGSGAAMNDKYSKGIIESCFRVDTKTRRLISQGFVVFDNKAVFLSESDALDYLRANGFDCKNFNVAHNAGEAGTIEACWHEYFIELYES